MPKIELDITSREFQILGEALSEAICAQLQNKVEAMTAGREEELEYYDHWKDEYRVLLDKVKAEYTRWYTNASEEEIEAAGLG